MTAFPNGRNQLATFSSLSDLNAVNEQPFWDETDSKISSEPVEELLGLGLSSAKVWPSEKGAKTSLQARKGTSNVQNFLLARWLGCYCQRSDDCEEAFKASSLVSEFVKKLSFELAAACAANLFDCT